MQRDLASIAAMIGSAERAIAYVAGLDYSAFARDTMAQDAVIRRIEIIGEAASRVSEPTRRRFDHVPWAEAKMMRNKVIHHYDGVLLEIIWQTVEQDLPPLRDMLRNVLRELDP